MESLLAAEGLDTREPGQLLSLLDRIWDERPGVRTRNLYRYAPELLTPQERLVIETLSAEEAKLGRELTAEELEPKFGNLMQTVEEIIF